VVATSRPAHPALGDECGSVLRHPPREQHHPVVVGAHLDGDHRVVPALVNGVVVGQARPVGADHPDATGVEADGEVGDAPGGEAVQRGDRDLVRERPARDKSPVRLEELDHGSASLSGTFAGPTTLETTDPADGDPPADDGQSARLVPNSTEGLLTREGQRLGGRTLVLGPRCARVRLER